LIDCDVALCLQFCRKKKVGSSQHSGVQYWYSKCTPISNARDFEENAVEVEKTHLEDLIRYLESEKPLNTGDSVESEFVERTEAVEDIDQEPVVKADNGDQKPMEKVDDNVDDNREEPVERAENGFQELENVENGFQETTERVDDEFQEPVVVDVDFQEPMEREFVDDMVMEEQLDVDEPTIIA